MAGLLEQLKKSNAHTQLLLLLKNNFKTLMKTLSTLKKSELLTLVKNLANLSEDNGDYLKNFLASGSTTQRSDAALKRRKKTIYAELVNLDDYVGLPSFNFNKIDKQLKTFQKVHVNYPLEILELCIYTVKNIHESAVEHQLEDDFYEPMAEYFDEAAQMAGELKKQGLDIESYISELKQLWDCAEDIGWDYDDNLKKSFEKWLGGFYSEQLSCNG